MNKNRLFFAVLATLLFVGAVSSCKMKNKNPFLEEYATPYEIPPFDQITNDDYLPALREGIRFQNEAIQAIVDNPDKPTFDNTVLALEDSYKIIEKVNGVFGALCESNSSDELNQIKDVFSAELTQQLDEIYMNEALFDRFKYLYDNRNDLGLAPDQIRAVEQYYKDFIRSGALLDADQKEELKKLNVELNSLCNQFGNNLLNATNEFAIVVDDAAQLSGIPENTVAVAAEEAASRGLGEGKWVFTLHAPSRLPVLQYADSRDLREKMYKGYTSLASSGEYNNFPVISKIVQARAKKARLLGFDTFGAYATDNVMAKNVENAENLLMQIWTPAVKKVNEEVAEMQALADSRGDNITIEPWDYYYYSDKVRAQKYDFDENQVRPYFQVDSVRKGIFALAERLYGVSFTEMPDAPKYCDEVTVYDVTDNATGEHLAVFMTDYFSRPSKRQGAWMDEMKTSWVNPDGTPSRPIVFNVANFSRPTADMPSLLSVDDVETMFHEFGHGLHGMLSKARLKSQSGTSVDRDFVELPSQITEHWAFEPELLKVYAHHYQTGEVLPDSLIEKMNAASKYGNGFATAELAGAALLDLQYAKLNPEGEFDAQEFENQVAAQLGMPSQLTFRYRSPYFKHIFDNDQYASGYYTYLWAEVLDTDAFELFKENGVFDPATAKSFKENILEKGGSEDPMVLFVRFRGQEPTVDALLRHRGLKD